MPAVTAGWIGFNLLNDPNLNVMIKAVDMFADVLVYYSSASPGGAAEHAAARKSAKYSSMSSSHIFQPLALQTLCPITPHRHFIPFWLELFRRVTIVSGEPRRTMQRFQRISLVVQRYTVRLLSRRPFGPHRIVGLLEPLQLTVFLMFDFDPSIFTTRRVKNNKNNTRPTCGEDFNFAEIHSVVDQRKLYNDVSEEKVSLIDVGTQDSDCSSVRYCARILTTQCVLPQNRCLNFRIGIG